MSQPPPNPDPRQLPPGWIQQYDYNYKAWFYVNTQASPPVTTWTHPLGPAPPSPSPPYSAPAGPPPPNSGPYNNSNYGYNSPQGGGEYDRYNPGYGQQGYGGNQPDYYPQQQQYQQGNKGLLGGLFGRHNNQSQYGQPPPQPVYEQAPPKKHGLSTGGALALGAGAGLGAFLIGDAIEDHIQNDEFQAYEQGYDNGQQQDDDYGGGDGGW